MSAGKDRLLKFEDKNGDGRINYYNDKVQSPGVPEEG